MGELSKSNSLSRKAINFDLGTNALKEHYPGKNHRDAYSEIKKYMEQHGFEHRQYSGYNSKAPMSDTEVAKIISGLSSELPWLEKCIQKIDSTDIGEQHDLTDIVINEKNKGVDKDKKPTRKPSAQKKSKQSEQPKKSDPRPSVLGAIKELQAQQRNDDENNKSRDVTRNKNDQSR